MLSSLLQMLQPQRTYWRVRCSSARVVFERSNRALRYCFASKSQRDVSRWQLNAGATPSESTRQTCCCGEADSPTAAFCKYQTKRSIIDLQDVSQSRLSNYWTETNNPVGLI